MGPGSSAMGYIVLGLDSWTYFLQAWLEIGVQSRSLGEALALSQCTLVLFAGLAWESGGDLPSGWSGHRAQYFSFLGGSATAAVLEAPTWS